MNSLYFAERWPDSVVGKYEAKEFDLGQAKLALFEVQPEHSLNRCKRFLSA